MVGSPGMVVTDHLLALCPWRPLWVRTPLGTLAAPARDIPRPRYLVESDCIQGKGTLGVQAATALRSAEEQEEKEKGKHWGERSGAENGGSHNAGARKAVCRARRVARHVTRRAS